MTARFDRAVAGEDDDLGVGQLAFGFAQDLESADALHDEVGDDDVEALLFDEPEPFAPTVGDDAFIPDAFEALGHGFGVRLVVIDHKNANLLIHQPQLCSGSDATLGKRTVN